MKVILTPAEIARLPQTDLSSATCVVFDVLRATSTIVTALANGARRVIPAANIDEARAWQRDHFPDALLGGERRGIRIEGFNLGNSPREYTANVVAGRDIISTTTNGTIAIRACAGAAELHAGSLLNLDALAAQLRSADLNNLVLVCAGSGSAFSAEDALGAGLLLEALAGDDSEAGGDAGLALRALVARYASDLPATLAESYNGRALTRIGLAEDVAHCARLSCFEHLAVARVEDGVMSIVRREGAPLAQTPQVS